MLNPGKTVEQRTISQNFCQICSWISKNTLLFKIFYISLMNKNGLSEVLSEVYQEQVLSGFLRFLWLDLNVAGLRNICQVGYISVLCTSILVITLCDFCLTYIATLYRIGGVHCGPPFCSVLLRNQTGCACVKMVTSKTFKHKLTRVSRYRSSWSYPLQKYT